MVIDVSSLLGRIERRDVVIGVIGLGYVGVPLALTAAEHGFKVLGFDIDEERVARLNRSQALIKHIAAERIRRQRETDRFEATADFGRLPEADAILIAVPTPLSKQREPDLSFVEATTRTIARHLRPGQLVILESTTYPGTTRQVMKPILEASGLACGKDFYLAYSPEREDPGNETFDTRSIPKVVGGDGEDALALASALYGQFVDRVVPVSTPEAAEAAKLTENIFRAVNIALVNELKIIYSAMGIDVWEVIDAAATKPFGFMPFYPGPGLGGHCIPIDPFYLTWKAREYDTFTRFIELAGQINTLMPAYVVQQAAEALDRTSSRGLNGARILMIGLAYKKNVDDLRESPSLKLVELLEARGAHVDFHDPHIAEIPKTREHAALAGRRSVALEPASVAAYDCVLVATDHDAVDYALLADNARLLIDTRNAFPRRGITRETIVKA